MQILKKSYFQKKNKKRGKSKWEMNQTLGEMD